VLYWKVAFIFETLKKAKGLVSSTQFVENLELQLPHFLKAVKRGIAEDASQADMEAAVFHSKYFYNGWIAINGYFLRGVLVVTTKAHYS
jgi:hypothetical protein